MKKKILYSVIAVLLIGLLVIAYMQMSGNTVHKQRAKESLETFLQQTYPDVAFEIKQVGYGWTDVTYEFEVVKKDSLAVETTYTFYVSGMEPYEVFSDTIHETNIDKEVSNKLNAEAEQYILTLLQGEVPQVNSVSTDVGVYDNVDVAWTPKLKTPKPMHIMLEIEKGELTREQMLQQCKTIQELLNNESINYYMAEVGYHSVENGEEIYEYVSFTPDQELTLDDLD